MQRLRHAPSAETMEHMVSGTPLGEPSRAPTVRRVACVAMQVEHMRWWHNILHDRESIRLRLAHVYDDGLA